jgi:hypothetical protein
MAQLGDFARAKVLLRRAGRAFGEKEAVACARCTVAEAEVALAARDLGWPPGRLDEAGAAEVAAADRRVEPTLDDAARREQRAAWRTFVPRAAALEATSEPAVPADPPGTPRRTTG